MTDLYEPIAKWANDNQGVVEIGIFICAIALAWLSGIFTSLRRKPKFKLEVIPGPTFCCTYAIAKKHGAYDVHRTAIALYLKITNVGSAPSSIENVAVGYHWKLHKGSVLWLRYTIGWFWLNHQAVALQDFQERARTGSGLAFCLMI